jgi:hypothetical protein
MKKTLLILIASIFTNSIIFSQSNYNYKEYQYPDLKVRGMNFSGSSKGNLQSSGLNQNQFSFSPSLNYFEFDNSQKKQKTDNFYLLMEGNNFKTKNENNEEVNQGRFYFNLRKEQVNRKYINDKSNFFDYKRKFYEINHIITTEYNSNFQFPLGLGRIEYFQISGSLPLAFGFGRMEPTREIYTAQFLIDDLKEEGLLQQEISQSQLYELAQLMAKVSNQRIFDFRRATKYQLKEISNWFINQNIPIGIDAFTTITDNWLSATTLQRLEGKRLTFGLVPEIQFLNVIGNNLIDGQSLNYNFEAFTKFENFRNINQYFNREFTLFGSFRKAFFQDDISTSTSDFLNFGVQTTFGYNPNSRTTYSISPLATAMFSSIEDLSYEVSVPLRFNYFINYNTRLVFNAVPIYRSGFSVTLSPLLRPSFLNQEFNSNFLTNSFTRENNLVIQNGLIQPGLSFNWNFSFVYNFF